MKSKKKKEKKREKKCGSFCWGSTTRNFCTHAQIWGSCLVLLNFKTKISPSTQLCQLRKENMELPRHEVKLPLSEEKQCEHIQEQPALRCHCRWITSCFARSRTVCSATMSRLTWTQLLGGYRPCMLLGLTVVMILILLGLDTNLEGLIR